MGVKAGALNGPWVSVKGARGRPQTSCDFVLFLLEMVVWEVKKWI